MLKQLPLRIAAPTVLLSFLLLAMSIAAAIYLYLRQASSEAALGENINSAQAAHDLENTLKDVVVLLRGRGDAASLHERIRLQSQEVRDLADKDEEQRLVGLLEDVLDRYFELWQSPREPDRELATRKLAQTLLEEQALPICTELQEFNAQQIKESEQANRASVRWMILGLFAVSSIGALVGLVLGYGVARRVGRSIYHLRVHIQDAAQKLGRDLPDVSLVEGDDLQHLHNQLPGVVHEIEQVVAMLQQREREVFRAEQLSAVGQLAAGVAHELRNPLTSIKLLVQTNREEAQARGASVEDLAIIDQEIRRMEHSLQHFLDFARPPRLERRRIDLAEPLERTLALVAGRAAKQHVVVDFRRPETAVFLEADREQLQQLFVNLVLNALDAMPRGGMLKIEVSHPLAEFVEVLICDSGPGISPEIMVRLFQPFLSNKATGLGLGLMISRRIAESHDGTLQAANDPAGGACFVLRLPFAIARAPELAEAVSRGS